jgi:hypothetical protein
MKSITLILLMSLSALSVMAQKSLDQPTLFHFSVGNSISGGARATGIDDDSTIVERNRQNNPTLTFGVDYLVSERWSVGLMLGYNRIYTERHFDDGINQTVILESGNINRFYAGVRGLIHYGKNEKIDWYSGFKVGTVAFRTSGINNFDMGEEELDNLNSRNRLSLGLIPIGMRFFVTDQFGGHIQLSIGSPTFASAGLNFRL